MKPLVLLLSAGVLGAPSMAGEVADGPVPFRFERRPSCPGSSLAGLASLSTEAPDEQKSSTTFSQDVKDGAAFLGGAFVGLLLHEAGHVAADLIIGTDPTLKRVDTAGIPFFAVTYRGQVTPRQEFAIAAAGFWVQHAMSEALLSKYPHLWRDAPPSAKGAFAFHLATSLIYAYAAFAKSGPPERDTLGMARGAAVDERWIGVAVLLPAVLDLYRSLHPEARWAKWSSRSLKIGLVFGLTR